MSSVKTQLLLQELNAEYKATRHCLERIPESTFEFKPHPKSMNMHYLVLLVAEIPLWIKHMIEDGEIDFVTFKHEQPKTTGDVVAFFERNMEGARKALQATSDEKLETEKFTLKANGQVLYTAHKLADIMTTLNHWVHHRGQLTVYMRLNDLAVPSIYGPSADEKNFTSPG
ncbi:MAG TPA: DinB family protein [Chitinophagaceae bacterium]